MLDEQLIREQAKGNGVTHFATGIAVVDGGKVLLVQRSLHDYRGGQYELPGGGVEENEGLLDAAARELVEETGLTIGTLKGMFKGFDYSTSKKPKVRQLNFLVTTTTGEIRLDPNEHIAYVWSGPDDYADLPMSEEIRACLGNVFELIQH